MPHKIAYITDIHLDEQFPKDQGVHARDNWGIILDDIAHREVDEVIFGGDMGEPSSNEWFFESLAPHKVSVTLGNHDTYSDIVKHYLPSTDDPNQNELYYIHEYDQHRAIFLDSSAESISTTQYSWLEKALRTPKDILLFIHHPILPVPAKVDELYALNGRAEIQNLLLQHPHKVDIFCGHYHFDDIRSEQNITQQITPASSYQVEKNPTEVRTHNHNFGYRILTVEGDHLHTELIML